jgi:hypothetical protein
MLQFPPPEKARNAQPQPQQQQSQQQIVSDTEWSKSIREIVQRDYFPVQQEEEEDGDKPVVKKLRLDEYLNKHTSEDNIAFQKLMKQDQERQLAKINSRNQLKLNDAHSTYRALPSGTIRRQNGNQQREIIPKNTRFPNNTSSSTSRRLLPSESRDWDGYELVHSFDTVLSGPGKALADRLRNSQRRS